MDKTSHPPLDAKDKAIIAALLADGRMTNHALAERVNLSPAACHRRHRMLEERGVIVGYRALVDREKVGLGQNVFVEITLRSQGHDELQAFEDAVQAVPSVIECHLMTGDYDFLLHVIARNTGDYERLHRDVLTALPGVSRVRSNFSMRPVRATCALPLEQG